MDAFIDDGYTEVVGIEAVDGLHPAMEFTRRPFAGNDAQEAFRRIELGPSALHSNPKKRDPKKIQKEQTPAAKQARIFDTIIERVSDWEFPVYDEKGEKLPSGRPPELNHESLRKMRGKLFEKFYNVVFGYDVPDYVLDDEGNRKESDPEGDAGNSTPESSS